MTGPAVNDDDVTALVGHLRDHLAERESAWLEVLHGDRSIADVSQSRRDAGDDEAEIAAASALFAPVDSEEEAELVSALLDASATRRRTRPSAHRRWLTPTLGLAAAVVLAWALAPTPASPVASAPPPAYGELETDGGLLVLRSDDAPVPTRVTYRPGSPFQWVLRPKGEHAAGMGARAFVSSAGSPPRRLAIEPEVDTGGAVRFHGQIDALGLEAGAWVVVIVVGPVDTLPTDARDAVALDGGGPWIVRRLELELEP